MTNRHRITSTLRGSSFVGRLAALLVLCIAASAPAAGREVMIHGCGIISESKNPLWIVEVNPKRVKEEGADAYFRERPGNEAWLHLDHLPPQIGGVTGQSDELVILFENGKWAYCHVSRFSYGTPLPGEGSRIAMLAGDRKSLWAIGRAGTSRTQGTRPATLPATAPTIAPDALQIFSLEGARWTSHGLALPAERTEADLLSMAIVMGRPVIAVAGKGGMVDVLQFSKPNARWEALFSHAAGDEGHCRVKVLNVKDQAGLWVWTEGTPGPGVVRVGEQILQLKAAEIKLKPALADLAYAGEQYWLVYRQDDNKLYQTRFARDSGSMVDAKPAILAAQEIRGDNKETWITLVIMTVITFVVLTIVMRRRKPDDDAPARNDDEE